MIEVSLFVLFAPPLALMAAGVLYQLQEKNKAQKTFNDYPDTSLSGKTTRQSGHPNYFLVLVVSAKQEKVIQSINNNKEIKADDCWPLYRATQALWMGDQSALSNLKINSDFLTQPKVLDTSEYDVYFLLISLSKYEIGFTKNVTSIDRSDAFEKLPQISTGVQVSPRLHCSAYELSFLYAR
ncbi:hypothetical protein [Limnoraphis robusta]|uniref:Uncharacterized protein n=1 Tax=Limnoraphis robusta CCNP1315 TaxID=3110306 RepID=A0ABU5TTA4_9CYAN|nr:hypothetical protein [Limnoraphis robusta]MEA5517920.1 hypothetical protein [Limnoraphis robusta CCNP1315]MEA5543739.1 hypothetical protein [Limnoraphis robusta CCNP1324]